MVAAQHPFDQLLELAARSGHGAAAQAAAPAGSGALGLRIGTHALLFALAGPHRPEYHVERVGQGAEIVLLLDRSRSMDQGFAPGRALPAGISPKSPQALDHYFSQAPARLRESKGLVARRLLAEFTAQRPDDRFALVAFSTLPMAAATLGSTVVAVLKSDANPSGLRPFSAAADAGSSCPASASTVDASFGSSAEPDESCRSIVGFIPAITAASERTASGEMPRPPKADGSMPSSAEIWVRSNPVSCCSIAGSDASWLTSSVAVLARSLCAADAVLVDDDPFTDGLVPALIVVEVCRDTPSGASAATSEVWADFAQLVASTAQATAPATMLRSARRFPTSTTVGSNGGSGKATGGST